MPDENISHAYALIIAVVILTTLSTLSFAGRIWGRLLSALSFGLDDLLMAFATVRLAPRLSPSSNTIFSYNA